MTIRPATASDYPVFVRLFAELQTGDDTPSERSWADDLAPQSLLYQRDGEAVAYVYVQILGGLGYVRHVAVDPRHRGAGIGRALLQEVAARLRARGIEHWCLNVKPDNAPALGLYESLGMSIRYASVAMRMSWEIVERLPQPDDAIRTGPLLPDDDRAAEEATGLPHGLLAGQRSRPGRVLLHAREAEEIAGVAIFFPTFPGASPFRARTPAITCALLRAMEPHADRSKSYVQLVIEDAPEIADALQRAGAIRHLEIVHMRGDVPR